MLTANFMRTEARELLKSPRTPATRAGAVALKNVWAQEPLIMSDVENKFNAANEVSGKQAKGVEKARFRHSCFLVLA